MYYDDRLINERIRRIYLNFLIMVKLIEREDVYMWMNFLDDIYLDMLIGCNRYSYKEYDLIYDLYLLKNRKSFVMKMDYV